MECFGMSYAEVAEVFAAGDGTVSGATGESGRVKGTQGYSWPARIVRYANEGQYGEAKALGGADNPTDLWHEHPEETKEKYGSVLGCGYWLRSAGTSGHACWVSADGLLNYGGGSVTVTGASLRPALWIQVKERI